jgi:chitin disaccharide deacetylase
MEPNPILRKLGLSETDRAVIFHADDIGMSHSSLAAYADVLAFGLLSSASTMVPCPWFPATAAFCRQERDNSRLDMGVHLTLTSEWQGMRWRPLASRDPAGGLVDAAGYFYDNCEAMQARATETAVRQELQAQIDRALAAGVDATHIDSHMFGIFHPGFLPVYFDLAREYELPAFMVRGGEVVERYLHFDEETAAFIAGLTRQAEADGIPLLDDVYVTSLSPLPDRLAHACERLVNLKPGITYFVIHPNHDTPELRAMAPDWEARVQDYELFVNEAWRTAVAESGVHVLGYRALRDLMRSR